MIDKEWLEKRYVHDLASVADMAMEVGCGTANIRRLLKKWKILRGKNAIVGKPAWNSGLTKDSDERLAKLSKDRMGEGNPMYGVQAWNCGLTKETDERVAEVSRKRLGFLPEEVTREKMRQSKLGKVGQTANAWKGGQQYCNGYGVSCLPDTGELIYTHRHVAEEIIGRKLSHDEHVHHMDCNKLNNRPDNLLILSNSDHIKLHAAIAAGSADVHTQVAWLKSQGIKFLEVKNESIERQAA